VVVWTEGRAAVERCRPGVARGEWSPRPPGPRRRVDPVGGRHGQRCPGWSDQR